VSWEEPDCGVAGKLPVGGQRSAGLGRGDHGRGVGVVRDVEDPSLLLGMSQYL